MTPQKSVNFKRRYTKFSSSNAISYIANNRFEDLLDNFDWNSYFWAGAAATEGKAIRIINFELSPSKEEQTTPEFVIFAMTDEEIMWWEVEENA